MLSRVNKKHLYGVIIASAVVFASYLGYTIWKQYDMTHQPGVSISSATIEHSTDTPDETPPNEACDAYQVPDNQPRTITIGSIGAKGCIQKVATDQHGAIAVPDNVHLAGWYTNSPLPGEMGVSLIDGHVLGKYGDALFARLASMKNGDLVQIEFGDRSVRRFEVIDVNSYSAEGASQKMLEQHKETDRQLNLITCGGVFNRQTQTYDKRIIVRTKLTQ